MIDEEAQDWLQQKINYDFRSTKNSLNKFRSPASQDQQSVFSKSVSGMLFNSVTKKPNYTNYKKMKSNNSGASSSQNFNQSQFSLENLSLKKFVQELKISKENCEDVTQILKFHTSIYFRSF